MTKIIFTSDIHYPITSTEKVEELISHIASENPNILILGGDIAENIRENHRFDFPYLRWCLSKFKDAVKCPILAFAGNHDLWTGTRFTNDSQAIWNILPSVFKNEGIIYLEQTENSEGWYRIEDIMILGSYLHYDYSAAEKIGPTAGYTDKYWAVNKKNVNNDGNFMFGLPNDKLFAKQLSDKLRNNLINAENNSDIRRIMIATHVPCMEKQITRKPYDLQWALATPYFGNLSIQDDILHSKKVTHVLSGHSHTHEDHVIFSKNDREIRVITNGSDYGRPVYQIIT